MEWWTRSSNPAKTLRTWSATRTLNTRPRNILRSTCRSLELFTGPKRTPRWSKPPSSQRRRYRAASSPANLWGLLVPSVFILTSDHVLTAALKILPLHGDKIVMREILQPVSREKGRKTHKSGATQTYPLISCMLLAFSTITFSALRFQLHVHSQDPQQLVHQVAGENMETGSSFHFLRYPLACVASCPSSCLNRLGQRWLLFAVLVEGNGHFLTSR